MEIPIKTFPISVPILGLSGAALLQPPAPAEEAYGPETAICGGLVTVRFSGPPLQEWIQRARRREWAAPEWFQLAGEAAALAASQADHPLLAPEFLERRWQAAGVVPYPHQLQALHRVIHEMAGRALLADEVGLGKTIEAGLVIRELMLRGLVRRVLILVPASLCWQWHQELREKFGIVAWMQRCEVDWERAEVLIASLDTAKRPPHREILAGCRFDLVVVDEAHRLKNPRTQAWRLVNALSKRYLLLLTATPVQNDLKELFSLVNLLNPGYLGTWQAFQQQFMADRRTPRRPQALRELLRGVMVRNRRGDDTVRFTRRWVHGVPVRLSAEESALYCQVSDYVRRAYRALRLKRQNPLALITLQREVCSSSYAAALSLDRMAQRARHHDPASAARLQELALQAARVQACSKADAAVSLVRKLGEKVIIFTEYLATEAYLAQRLQQEGFAVLRFDGSLSPAQREWVRMLFQGRGQVLISTESGGEGINLQFCCHVINFDLPWNPMRIEQRIGRVHRLGQTRDVHVYNLFTEGTIEEHVLRLLHEKIDMFRQVVGELDAILTRLGWDGASLEAHLADLVLRCDTEEELLAGLDHLGERVDRARTEHRRQAEQMDALLGLAAGPPDPEGGER